jgi:hypothetical protein
MKYILVSLGLHWFYGHTTHMSAWGSYVLLEEFQQSAHKMSLVYFLTFSNVTHENVWLLV